MNSEVNPERVTEDALDNVALYFVTPQLVQQLKESQSAALSPSSAFSTGTSGYQYVIGRGDVLQITIWDHPDIQQPGGSSNNSGNQVRVGDDGMIYYPYINKVRAAGRTVDQLRQSMTGSLSQYLQNPQLNVQVENYVSQKVYVTGAVNSPGVQPVTNVPLTVLDALNQAGGVSENALWNGVVLTREEDKIQITLEDLLENGDLSQNYLLKSGDVLHVPTNDREQVYVMGEVMQPQTLTLGRYGMTLTEAISGAHGIDEGRADATGIFVIRNAELGLLPNSKAVPPIADVYQLDISDATAFAMGSQIQLKPGDVVYVTAAPIALWNRVISNVVPSLTSTSSLKSIFEW